MSQLSLTHRKANKERITAHPEVILGDAGLGIDPSWETPFPENGRRLAGGGAKRQGQLGATRQAKWPICCRPSDVPNATDNAGYRD
jgi:hypothetical protein